ncbi:hypothetical protein BDW59DRAFT_154034 [Aspergillus cavernicola]|uniref:Uncharacterized protein n=1 Tax=Aspergillus cavernicola TaxID=176166 RepID=A0ABR4HHX2_9EURO
MCRSRSPDGLWVASRKGNFASSVSTSIHHIYLVAILSRMIVWLSSNCRQCRVDRD